MLNSQVFDTILAQLAGRTSSTLRANIVFDLNEKIRQFERGPIKPWFLETLLSTTMTAGLNYITLPSDFLEEVEEGAFRIQTTDGLWTDPVKVTMEQLELETDGEDPAVPEGYAIYGERFYLGPTPLASYNYKLKYYARTAAVADNSSTVTNKWLLEFFHYTTLSVAHYVASTRLQSVEMASKLAPELKLAADEVWRAVESRKHANMTYLLNDSET